MLRLFGEDYWGEPALAIAPVPGGGGGEVDFDLVAVGGIYETISSVDPGDPVVSGGLGYGTWARIGNGRLLVGVDEGDPDFDAPEDVGGSKTVTPAGTNSAPTFTGSALGTHSHGPGTLATDAHTGTAVADHAAHTHGTGTLAASAPTFTGSALATHNHTFTGSALGTHAHQLPLTGIGGTTPRTTASFGTSGGTVAGVRSLTNAASTTAVARELSEAVSAGTPAGTNTAITAGTPAGTNSAPSLSGSTGNPSATLTHAVTQPSAHTLSGSSAAITAGTPAGSVSAPAFTGAQHSLLAPFLAVYRYVRTA